MRRKLEEIKEILKDMNSEVSAILASDGISSVEWIRLQEQMEGFIWGLQMAYESMNVPFEYDYDEWGFFTSVRIDSLELIDIKEASV